MSDATRRLASAEGPRIFGGSFGRFLVVFVLPLLTRGVWLIWRQSQAVVADEPATSSAMP